MNRVKNKIGIRHPIIQGPFGGGLSTVELTSTVSNAGGLGSFGAHKLSSEEIENLCGRLREQTRNSFAINLWVSNRDESMEALSKISFERQRDEYMDLYESLDVLPPEWGEQKQSSFEQQVEAILRAKPKVFSFVFGIPSREILKECKKRGIITIGAATTIEEATKIEEAEIDFVLATGFEAGGHRPSFLQSSEESLYGTLSLIPAVSDAVSIPVIAGGGISDRRGIRAAMALGAEAVQLGTAFLACDESGASEVHKQSLRTNKNGHTALSRAYSGRLARFSPNAFTKRHQDAKSQTLPYPAQSWLTSPIKNAAIETNQKDYVPLYAGQGVPLIHHTSAKDLMNELSQEF